MDSGFQPGLQPSCAYNEEYVCPYIPLENQLDVEIKAGEKKYDKGNDS